MLCRGVLGTESPDKLHASRIALYVHVNKTISTNRSISSQSFSFTKQSSQDICLWPHGPLKCCCYNGKSSNQMQNPVLWQRHPDSSSTLWRVSEPGVEEGLRC